MTTPARSSAFPPSSSPRRAVGGELVQSLTYRESYSPAPGSRSSIYDRRLDAARRGPGCTARTAAAGAWALVSIVAASSLALVLVLRLVRVVGWLT